MRDSQPPSPLVEIRQLAACFLPSAEAADMTIAKPPVLGFSGSPVWLLGREQTGPRYVLKRLPTAVPPEQLAWTQQLACHLAAAGLSTVPVPLPAYTATGLNQLPGQFARDAAGQLWQCLSFRPGEPIARPAASEVVAAVTALAELHQVAAGFRVPMTGFRPTGWQTRIRQFMQLAEIGFAVPAPEHADAIGGQQEAWQRLFRAGREAASIFAAAGGHRLANRLVGFRRSQNLQPVLRDCWWRHVLFNANTANRCVSGLISGIIDLDAACSDSPAGDLARLLGSWQLEAADPAQRLENCWPAAFRRYADICRPAGDFPAEVQVLHDTAVVCGLDRWCVWLFQERRKFPDLPGVAARLEALLRALPAAITRLQRV